LAKGTGPLLLPLLRTLVLVYCLIMPTASAEYMMLEYVPLYGLWSAGAEPFIRSITL
jgi:hypothetical protein